ncbi:ABC transporter permease [Corynebacterium heidelbergense]|uniref:Peptide ABC transporter permease n=1 Tax=Corynebacterium heidelbergense TaxID=2055947 RepID=A0A364VAK7_9CORY|nr:peptide ABC transporter permease [Corynebacterium heidelbergense]WCZ37093.1 Oligopeptide transport system permease protein OppC [Corynebacterium heidelbergense]
MPKTNSPLPSEQDVRSIRWAAEVKTEDVLTRDQMLPDEAPTSTFGEAWKQMRKRITFWVALALIFLVILLAVVPGLFTSLDPHAAELSKSLAKPEGGHPFGFSQQGYDVYARTIYGARASVICGIATTFLVTIMGVFVGAVAGYRGGWLDSLLSRISDIFFAIPLLLAAIVLMQVFKSRNIWTVVLVLALFGWPQMARVVRSAVISVKNNEYVQASRALGLSSGKILLRHVLPNCLAPIIVMATTSLGIYIVMEATLSYLGIGLPPTEVSWGNDISAAQNVIREAPNVLFYPAGFLALTVLGFILLGDTLKDAFDPKERTR